MATTLDGELANLRRANAQLRQRLDEVRAERDEALVQKTALAEVMEVINRSAGNLGPVFGTILERAMRLCEATHGHVWRFAGGQLHAISARGDPRFIEWVEDYSPIRPIPGSAADRIVRGERLVPLTDRREEDADRGDPLFRALVEAGGVRASVSVALRKDEILLGMINVYRREPRPFTDKQIALLQNFAAQAVVAMENAQLLTETREALEQQTATADVLRVINESPGNLGRVFDAILEKAHTLCGSGHGSLYLRDGDRFRPAATRGVPEPLARSLRQGLPLDAPPVRPLLAGEPFAHITDMAAVDHPLARVAADAGICALLSVPLRRGAELIGLIVAARFEPPPFSDKQTALLQNFAAQAVIAMENARLLTETREALEQQTATAEVLQVINASPGDLAPVFETILDKAHTLCGATLGSLFLYDGELFRAAATFGYPEDLAQRLRRGVVLSATTQFLEGAAWVHNPDLRLLDAPTARAVSGRGGVRTNLMLPLRKDGRLLGAISCNRQEVRPFSDKQIALLQNFAAQAVIAMENARLLDEIRQRQAELRVTFDNMGDGVVMFDQGLRLAAWNRNFQQLLDLPETALALRPSYADYLRVLAERGEFGGEDIAAEVGRRLQATDRELRLERMRPDGRVIEVRRNAVPDGGFVLIYSDITERKRSEAEIRAARDAAEAAYRDLQSAQASLVQAEKMASLGQLTAGIAHEIKNPLNFVNNFAELSVGLLDELKETAAPAIAALGGVARAEIDDVMTMLTGNLGRIAEHGRRADGIVRSMLEHSRGSSGERRSIDLNQLVDEALNLAYHGARARDQTFNITLERDFASPMPAIELVPQDITRVCLNLFSNGFYAAARREQQGGEWNFAPTLRVSTRDLGAAVEIRVRDNGVGIPPEAKDKLFQPFFTTKPTGEGTGLGLSISHDIVTQQHGGTIEVDSRVNEFTEFRVRLPHVRRTGMAQAAS